MPALSDEEIGLVQPAQAKPVLSDEDIGLAPSPVPLSDNTSQSIDHLEVQPRTVNSAFQHYVLDNPSIRTGLDLLYGKGHTPGAPQDNPLQRLGEKGFLNASVGDVIGKQPEYVGGVVKGVADQANLQNALILRGLGPLAKAEGPIANVAKALIATYFGKEGAQTVGDTLGTRTAGVPMSPEEKGQSDVDTATGGLMMLGAVAPALIREPKVQKIDLSGNKYVSGEMRQGSEELPFNLPDAGGTQQQGRRVLVTPPPQEPFQEAPPLIGQRPLTVKQQVLDKSGIPISPKAAPNELTIAPRLILSDDDIGLESKQPEGGKISFRGVGLPSAGQGKEMLPGRGEGEQAARMQNEFVPSAEKEVEKQQPLVSVGDVMKNLEKVQKGVASRIVPAVREGARILVGEQGQTHADILQQNGLDPETIKHEDPRRGFYDPETEKFLDRKTAARMSGLETSANAGGLDSLDLPGAKEGQVKVLEKQATGQAVGRVVNKPQGLKPGPKSRRLGVASGAEDFEEVKKALKETELPKAVATIRDKEKELRGPFALSTVRMMVTPKEVGFSKTDAPVDVQQLINRSKNKLSSEFKVLEDLGVWEKVKQASKEGKITPEEAARVVQENGPKVEVHTYGMEGKVSEARKAYDKMTHEWYDNLKYEQKAWLDDVFYKEEVPRSQFTLEDYTKAQEYVELKRAVRGESSDSGPRATSAYSHVSPKDVKKFPLQRVDVTVPQKLLPKPPEGFLQGKELPIWNADSLHEQLPNTLGWAAYQDLPHEKYGQVRNAVEVQSRWGQKVRKAKEEVKHFGEESLSSPSNKALRNAENDHPLLHDYNRLILKAFIEQARKDGKRYVSIPDAETAMMSEGHDANLANTEIGNDWVQRRIRPPQESGMHLNYDTILPKIMEELTGQKGERVDLGEHKNAFEPKTYPEGTFNMRRKNLIFRNPDGTPKTSVTGLVYDLSKLYESDKGSFSLIDKDKLSSRPTYLFSGIPFIDPLKEEAAKSERSYVDKFLDWYKGNTKASKDWSPFFTRKEMQSALLEGQGNPIQTKAAGLRLPSSGSETTLGDRATESVNQALNSVYKTYDLLNKGDKIYSPMDVLFDRLDGGKAQFDGPLFQFIRWPMDYVFNRELNMSKDHIDPIQEVVKEEKLTKKNSVRLGIYSMVQQGMKDRMVENGVPANYIDNVVNSISKGELRVYKVIRQQLDSLFPGVQRVAKEVYNKDVQPVENYSPIHSDWRDVKKPTELVKPAGNMEIEDDAVRFLDTDFGPRGTKTTQGFTIERLPNAKTMMNLDFFAVAQRHIRDVSHFITSQPILKEIARTVRDPKFKAKYGDVGQDQIMNWLNTYAKQGRNPAAIPQINWLRKAFARGVLGFRVASQFVHLANVPLGMQRAGLDWYKRGVEAVVSSEGKAWLQKNLAETFERGGGELEILQSQGDYEKAAFAIPRYLDQYNSQFTAMGIYLRKLKESGKDWTQWDELLPDQKALAQAKVEARRAVASPLYKDLPPALRSTAGKILLQFQNTFMDQWSNIRYDLPQYLQNDPKRAMGLFIALSAMVAIESGIKYGAQQGEHALTGYHPKSDEDKTYWTKVEHEALRRVPGVSQAMSAYQYGSSGIPVADMVTELAKGGKTLVNADSPEERKLAGVRFATTGLEAAGIPGVGQASTLVQDKMKAEMFKPHAKRVEEQAKKDKLDLTDYEQRVEAEKNLKSERKPMTESQQVKAAQSYEKRMMERRQEVVNRFDKKDKAWLELRGIKMPGWGDYTSQQKTRVVYTEEEDKELSDRIYKAYSEVLKELKSDSDFSDAKIDSDNQSYANAQFRAAAKEARQEFKSDVIEGTAIPKKEKGKKKFSIFSP